MKNMFNGYHKYTDEEINNQDRSINFINKETGFNSELFFQMVITDVLSSALELYYDKKIEENKYDFIKSVFEEHVTLNFRKDGNTFWGTDKEVDIFIEKYMHAIEKFK